MPNYKINVLISMCLCGVNCRYDGKDVPFESFESLSEYVNFIPLCPEVIGGLTTPRAPAEKVGELILTNTNDDVTEQYTKGAFQTLNIAKKFKCDVAILKEYSPSCGVNKIYDGTFSGKKVNGRGVTAAILMDNGIDVYSDEQLDLFFSKYIKKTTESVA